MLSETKIKCELAEKCTKSNDCRLKFNVRECENYTKDIIPLIPEAKHANIKVNRKKSVWNF